MYDSLFKLEIFTIFTSTYKPDMDRCNMWGNIILKTGFLVNIVVINNNCYYNSVGKEKTNKKKNFDGASLIVNYGFDLQSLPSFGLLFCLS